MTYTNNLINQDDGFTLVEMAIVLSIMALILGIGLTLLSAQQDQQRINDTNTLLNNAQEALIGFAIVNGRLPCPASAASNGVESYVGVVGSSSCTNFYNGFLPAATLGFKPVDSKGYAIDVWNNRIRYAVTAWSNATPPVSNVFTTTNGMSAAWNSNLSPDLRVCSTAAGIAGLPPVCDIGPPSTSLASNGVPAVIYSTGKNGAYGGTGTDEAENPNPNSADNDRVFVYHTPNPDGATGGYFDDQVIWISPYILYSRMVQAGKLP